MFRESSGSPWKVLSKFMLPNHLRGPACSLKRRDVSRVPSHVLLELGRPELGVCLWPRQVAGAASMPEAAVNEDSELQAREDEIGPAWKAPLQAIPADALGPEGLSEADLESGRGTVRLHRVQSVHGTCGWPASVDSRSRTFLALRRLPRLARPNAHR